MTKPPYAELLKLHTQADPHGTGELVRLDPHAGVVGRPGFLHGGAIAGLCEYAAFTALRHALGDEPAVLKPITVTIDYLRGGKLEPTRARAEIVRLGRRIANLEVRAWQEDEAKPIALARLNFKLERAEP
jgi:uncharacterized protein (TIGR00369 family)